MLLTTAKAHFDEDIQRATDLVAHARGLQAGRVKDDILRGAWMMAVGACDAYFSDAYADLISRTLRAKDLQPQVNIPDRLGDLRIPAIAVIRQARGGWRWRMAARELMERESVLSLERIKKLFNLFFQKGSKLLTEDTIGQWIVHRKSRVRLFGISPTQYRKLQGTHIGQAKRSAIQQFESVFEATFQRRHDCIHNCDRPRTALQPVRDTIVGKKIEDVVFLVERCNESLVAEFPLYLRRLGFNGATRNQVCA